MNYTFWWNCNNACNTVAGCQTACGDPDGTTGNANGIKFNGINDNPKSVSHLYSSVDAYTPKVIAERSTAPAAESRTIVTVSACPPDCSCESVTCIGDICFDGCGGTCAGTMNCACISDCSCAADTCAGQTCPDVGQNCSGTCNGTKDCEDKSWKEVAP